VVTRPAGEGVALLTGLDLLETPDPDRIASAVIRLLDDPAALRANAEAAARAAQHWSWDAIVGQYSALYDELAGHRR
jgi:glycosyltransferase involved in cell wall biosynthesis